MMLQDVTSLCQLVLTSHFIKSVIKAEDTELLLVLKLWLG